MQIRISINYTIRPGSSEAKKNTGQKNGMKVLEMIVSDTNSSRALHVKSIHNDGLGFFLMSLTDTLSARSPFLGSFFDSFTPADTLQFVNPYTKKSKIFFSIMRS